MTKHIYKFTSLLFFLCIGLTLFAGNPDRQGEAGSGHLLMTPWARSAGLHTLNTAHISGVEAMRVNPAGISRINKTQFAFGYTSYFTGADINVSSFGVTTKLNDNAAFGVSIMSTDLSDIQTTTEIQPEGTGATFSPSLFNLGVSYSYIFDNKISVGALVRVVSESISDARALGFGIDAGVQYVTGDQDNFRFGISLRNVGSRMAFGGQGLTESLQVPFEALDNSQQLAYYQRSQSYELPSLLNIGMGYDFYFGTDLKLTALGNFTANSFSQDQIGAGVEFGWKNTFQLRAAYKYEIGQENIETAPVYTGIAAGFSVNVPLSKDEEKVNNNIRIDYAYRQTRIWSGTHNITVSLAL